VLDNEICNSLAISTASFSTFTIENNTACEQVVVRASITR